MTEQLVLVPPRRLTFRVALSPIGQGSMVVNEHGGVHHTNAALEPYRQAVALIAKNKLRGAPKIGQPNGVELWCRFHLPRPAGATYPMPTKTTAGVYDLDKLVRAIGDALEKVCYENDSQIVRSITEKVWATGRPYVEIALIEVPA